MRIKSSIIFQKTINAYLIMLICFNSNNLHRNLSKSLLLRIEPDITYSNSNIETVERKICLKIIKKTPERISEIFMVLSLLNLNK